MCYFKQGGVIAALLSVGFSLQLPVEHWITVTEYLNIIWSHGIVKLVHSLVLNCFSLFTLLSHQAAYPFAYHKRYCLWFQKWWFFDNRTEFTAHHPVFHAVGMHIVEDWYHHQGKQNHNCSSHNTRLGHL